MALNINEQARKEANLRLLQRSMDRSISDILVSATHVVLYNFDQASQSWEKSNVEGSLFLAARPSGYLLVILNRNSPDNYAIELTSDFQLQNNDPYLIFKNYQEGKGTATIRGIWFPNANERTEMNDKLMEVLQALKNPPPPTPSAIAVSTPAAASAAPIDPASATAALLASLNVGVAYSTTTTNNSSTPPAGNSMRQMSPSSANQQPTLDKKSLQLALLSLIQDDRFLDLLHAQYLKVHHARTNRSGSNGSSAQQPR
jgi:mRNA-decapping enzyme 1B